MKAVFVHPAVPVERDASAKGMRSLAFTHVPRGVCIGRNCGVGVHCFLPRFAELTKKQIHGANPASGGLL